MKTDKFKNKDHSKFIPDEELHGKPDKRKKHREKSKVKKILRRVDHYDPDELDDLDLDSFEKI